jgi:hypothetical protein
MLNFSRIVVVSHQGDLCFFAAVQVSSKWETQRKIPLWRAIDDRRIGSPKNPIQAEHFASLC